MSIRSPLPELNIPETDFSAFVLQRARTLAGKIALIDAASGERLTTGVSDPDAWALRRLKLFGFVPDPETPEYPFHPESRNAMLAKCVLSSSGALEARYVPFVINRRSQPEPVGRDDRGQQVFEYVAHITRQAGFDTRFECRGDEVAVLAHSGGGLFSACRQ